MSLLRDVVGNLEEVVREALLTTVQYQMRYKMGMFDEAQNPNDFINWEWLIPQLTTIAKTYGEQCVKAYEQQLDAWFDNKHHVHEREDDPTCGGIYQPYKEGDPNFHPKKDN